MLRITGRTQRSILNVVLRNASLAELKSKEGGVHVYDQLDTVMPDGLGGKLDRDVAENRTLPVIVRPHTIKLIEVLDEIQKRNFEPGAAVGDEWDVVRKNPSHLVLNGVTGAGKSTALTQAVEWARTNGWLALWINNTYLWSAQGNLTRNVQDPSLWDQNGQAKSYLEEVLAASSSLLSRLPTKRNFEIGKRFRSNGTRLVDLATFALEYDRYATQAFWELRKELSLVTEVPVMIAIDDVGRLFGNSDFRDPESMAFIPAELPAARLTLTHALLDHHAHGLLRGMCLSALTTTLSPNAHFWAQNKKTPFNLVTVPPTLTRMQFNRYIEYMHTQGKFTHMDSAWCDMALTMSSGRVSTTFDYLRANPVDATALLEEGEDEGGMQIKPKLSDLVGTIDDSDKGEKSDNPDKSEKKGDKKGDKKK